MLVVIVWGEETNSVRDHHIREHMKKGTSLANYVDQQARSSRWFMASSNRPISYLRMTEGETQQRLLLFHLLRPFR
jgi:hypothetical protein